MTQHERIIVIVAVAFVVIAACYLSTAFAYRVECARKNLKFKDNLPTRLGAFAIVTTVLAILMLIPLGLITFGKWLVNIGYTQNFNGSDFVVFIYFIGHLLVMGIGFIIQIISILMVALYSVIELYAIWHYFTKPEIKRENDNVREVKSDGETWKEI